MGPDYKRDRILADFSKQTLMDRYMLPGEKSPQDAFFRAATAFADDEEHAQRLYNYASNLWFMFATPLLSNGGSDRGLPISCFLNYVPDSIEGLAGNFVENVYLSSRGGGIGTYWGKIRPADKTKSSGVIPHIKVQDAQTLAYKQGSTRRGSAAVYLDIDHPEIEEFLDIRKPTGDANRRSINVHHGVLLSDKFMRVIEAAAENPGYDDSWDLLHPKTGEVIRTVSAKVLWIKLLQNRMELGEPYCIFIDAANRAMPDAQKNLGLKIWQSNLCTEIMLPTGPDHKDNLRTAVCCLSSVNLEEFDQWSKDEQFIPDLIRMLDNALQVFIDTAPESMHAAIYSATQERSIGLGAMGFHAYLQRRDIEFESLAASFVNRQMISHLKSEAVRGSQILLEERGPCPDSIEGGGQPRRHMNLLAPAPNASSSIICDNTSPAFEAYRANIMTQKTLSGSHVFKNPYLEMTLQEIGQNTDETWKSILENKGSVQHLEFLNEHQKRVFKTAVEIDPTYIIRFAADRTPYICQSHSLNLFLPPDIDKKQLHDIHLSAWKQGLKSLYYLRSEAMSRVENTTMKIEKQSYSFGDDDCVMCEG